MAPVSPSHGCRKLRETHIPLVTRENSRPAQFSVFREHCCIQEEPPMRNRSLYGYCQKAKYFPPPQGLNASRCGRQNVRRLWTSQNISCAKKKKSTRHEASSQHREEGAKGALPRKTRRTQLLPRRSTALFLDVNSTSWLHSS